MLGDSRFLQEDSGSGPDQPAHAEWSGCMDQELAEPLEGKGQSRDLGETSYVWHSIASYLEHVGSHLPVLGFFFLLCV